MGKVERAWIRVEFEVQVTEFDFGGNEGNFCIGMDIGDVKECID